MSGLMSVFQVGIGVLVAFGLLGVLLFLYLR
ncbi:MAG: hypothetical protein RIR00_792, partial [Pseudomonadota bacterium]